jgi:hypothetical protein
MPSSVCRAPAQVPYRVLAKSGHRTIRFAFTDDRQAHQQNQQLHDALTG